MTNKNVHFWVEQLNLVPHPEGGFYLQTYKSAETISQEALPERFNGDRSYSTCIYYLLPGDSFSAFHKINQDELWHFYHGCPLTLHIISPVGQYSSVRLGDHPDNGEAFQIIVNAGDYFAAEPDQKHSYSLCGCTVAPGFEFADFDMPSRKELLSRFPQHQTIITQLTR